MTTLLVGNPSVLAIESSINQAYERLSQRALGFFVIYIEGRSYGVRSPDATLLACSFDAVQRRIARRGLHVAFFGSNPDAIKIVNAVRATRYDESRQEESFFGLTADEFRDTLESHEIVWAPDGDAAFDDGGHVLQFDESTRVRLIGFMNMKEQEGVRRTLTDAWINADDFYELLDDWQKRFEAEWTAAQKMKAAR